MRSAFFPAKGLLAALALLVSAMAGVSFGAQTGCPGHYLNGTAPDIVWQPMQNMAREVCFKAFGVVHSGVTKTPLWSAERLTPEAVAEAKELERVNAFHPEERLPGNERAELKDYSKSGYDRGHMAPNADMPDTESQQESFSLANMVPQDPSLNRGVWAEIEIAVRNHVKKNGEVYLITGPLFVGNEIKQLNGRLYIPTHVYKVVYDPRQKGAAVYLAENIDTHNYKVVSVAELEAMSGVNFFPGMPDAAKQRKIDLPEAKARKGGGGGQKRSSGDEPSSTKSILKTLKRILR